MKKQIKSAALISMAFALCIAGKAFGGTEYEWSIDLDCAQCHAHEVESLAPAEAREDSKDSSKASEAISAEAAKTEAVSNYAQMHSTVFKMECVTCHVDSDGLAKGHKKLNSGKEATRLKKSEVTSDTCLTCHQADKLAKTTEDYKGLVDSNGRTENPHALPDIDSHSAIVCTDCHQAHSGKTIDATAITTCTNCHHANVFECGTCH